jgi:hypothetical protein
VSVSPNMLCPITESVRKAWAEYIDGASLDDQILLPEVAKSWRRCPTLQPNPVSGPESIPPVGSRYHNLRCRTTVLRQTGMRAGSRAFDPLQSAVVQ